MNYIGDFSEDSTVRIVLATNNTSGAAVAPSSAFEEADFRIYKNGSATQKATTNGITIASPFDSVTGLHVLNIDTSNDTGDSGFWTTGADYWVVATPDETIDSQTVVAVIATFSIQNRYSSARLAAIEEDTLDIQSRIPAALVGGRIDASVGAYQSGMAPPTTDQIEAALVNEGDATALLQAIADKIAGDLTAGDLTALAIVSAIKADATLAQMISRIDVTLSTRPTLLQIEASTVLAKESTLTTIKGAGFSSSTDTLEKIAESVGAISSGTGSGARTVTITVELSGDPVEGALVRLTKAAETYLGTTDSSGEVVFNVDDGTWTVAITAANASFDGDELIVNGDETATYTVTATSLTPSSASLVTGYWTCYTHTGVVESGVTITMICKKVPSEAGFALDSAVRTATSGVDGVAQFANLIPGATYQVKRGSGENYSIKVPDDATGTVELNSIIGT